MEQTDNEMKCDYEIAIDENGDDDGDGNGGIALYLATIYSSEKTYLLKK